MDMYHPNLGKAFTVFALSVLKILKKAIAQSIHREKSHGLLKICKNCKGFVPWKIFV